jgi:hypothetical protein
MKKGRKEKNQASNEAFWARLCALATLFATRLTLGWYDGQIRENLLQLAPKSLTTLPLSRLIMMLLQEIRATQERFISVHHYSLHFRIRRSIPLFFVENTRKIVQTTLVTSLLNT